MHLSSKRTGLKVDADNIPELGGFLSRDFGSKYHNLYTFFSTAIVFLIVIVITIKLYDQNNEIY
jgi:hypothetical protein